MPAVLYGRQVQSQPLFVEAAPFQKLYRAAGESTLIDIQIDEQAAIKALIQDVQCDPVKGQVIHIDFRQVAMEERLRTPVTLKFIGESAAVKDAGGILVKNLDEVLVECLAKDLMSEINVDISALKAIGEKIRIRDLILPPGIIIITEPETIVASVITPQAEEIKEEKPEEKIGEIKTVAEEKKEKEKEKGPKEEKSA